MSWLRRLARELRGMRTGTEEEDRRADEVLSRCLTWTCHVCGDLRPDSKISVHDGGVGRVQVRYCNDRVQCRAGAIEVGEKML